MNKIILLMIMTVMGSSQMAFADSGHSGGNAMGDQGSMGMMGSGAGISRSDSGGMMDYERLRERMDNAERLMERARSARNDNNHDSLMREHMGELQNMMGMMHGMMMGGNGNMSGMQGNAADIQSMMNNQQMMGQRLDMMQRMMEQMLEQQSMMIDR